MTTTNESRIAYTERLGNTLIITPVCDLGETQQFRIEHDANDILSMFELTKINNVVLDMERADFAGSSAVNFFIRLWRRCRERQGKIVFCHVSPHEREILRLSRLDAIWPIYATREEAIEAVSEIPYPM